MVTQGPERLEALSLAAVPVIALVEEGDEGRPPNGSYTLILLLHTLLQLITHWPELILGLHLTARRLECGVFYFQEEGKKQLLVSPGCVEQVAPQNFNGPQKNGRKNAMLTSI